MAKLTKKPSVEYAIELSATELRAVCAALRHATRDIPDDMRGMGFQYILDDLTAQYHG